MEAPEPIQSVSQSVCLAVGLSVRLSVCQSVCLSVCLSVRLLGLWACLFVFQILCWLGSMFASLWVWLSVCL